MSEKELAAKMDAALAHVDPDRRKFLGILLAGVAAAPLLTSASLAAENRSNFPKADVGHKTNNQALKNSQAAHKGANAQLKYGANQHKVANSQLKHDSSQHKGASPQLKAADGTGTGNAHKYSSGTLKNSSGANRTIK
jgi:hypothetical protein